jgi:putative membrane protein
MSAAVFAVTVALDDLPVTALWVLVIGLIGIALLFVGYKVFDKLTPGLHIERELAEKNMAVAIVIATMLVSLSIIVAKAVG